ncbi:MAG: hypothetical protein Hyperionvirus1_17 [Hyperionvirus sp.]|uniref:Serine dehydrogenase proteinase n=1 Tax=Hyperionvirus sp. TaxID=2487770 RepID=A0A3G5A5I2_9VIRU|nr:MAG: hypothetical protein Hyperionvirus1_17 [Hyperionvirus sp.]
MVHMKTFLFVTILRLGLYKFGNFTIMQHFFLLVSSVTMFRQFMKQRKPHNLSSANRPLVNFINSTDPFDFNDDMEAVDEEGVKVDKISPRTYIDSKADQKQNVLIIDGAIGPALFKRFEAEYKSIGKTDKPLTLIIRSRGGAAFETLKFINILQKHKGKLTCYIHEYAMSAGTIIALMCDQIYLANGCISPIDCQPFGLPVFKLLMNRYYKKFFSNSFHYKYLETSYKGNILIANHIAAVHSLNRDQYTKFLDLFINVNVMHQTPYYFKDIRDLGLKINNDRFPEEIGVIIRREFRKSKIFKMKVALSCWRLVEIMIKGVPEIFKSVMYLYVHAGILNWIISAGYQVYDQIN